jgi:hypothetical protein
VPALIFHADRGDATAVRPHRRVPRSDVDGKAVFQEFGKRLIEHL